MVVVDEELSGPSRLARDRVDLEEEDSSSVDHPDEHHRSRLMEEMLGIRKYLFEKLHLTNFGRDQADATRHLPKVLDTVDFAGLLKHWNEGKFKKIITMVGAGISTCKNKNLIPLHSIILLNPPSLSAAGIPDFRSPKTGLYHNLQKYDLPHPSAIFELDYFVQNPKPFFTLAKELYPGAFKPTPCHYFIKLLESKGLLVRHYTQNIDTLEHIAGISAEKIVEAHGSFYTNHCLTCRQDYTKEWMKAEIFADRIPTCSVPECGGIVKPDIVFFGESLPAKFHDCMDEDFDDCDLLIIMGTSLEVQPFAALPDRVNDSCVRLLVNREVVGNKGSIWSILSGMGIGGSLEFGQPHSRRDVAWLSDCDEGVLALARGLGFEEELKHLIEVGHAEIDGGGGGSNLNPGLAAVAESSKGGDNSHSLQGSSSGTL